MAIVKNSSSEVPRLVDYSGFSPPPSGGSISTSSDGEYLLTESTSAESWSEMSDVDSGMESDECDYSELVEPGSEFCQVGKQSCMIPRELYDLPDLKSVLSMDAWNTCLSEEERFSLAEYLPDMDQVTFMQTLKELLSGDNMHFGSPLLKFSKMLKGGLCEPRVVLYHQVLNLLQRRVHYHCMRKYHNSMVDNLVRIRNGWENLAGYGLAEKLRFLVLSRNQETWKYNDAHHMSAETDSEDKESRESSWRKRLKITHQNNSPSKSSFDGFPRGSHARLGSAKFEKGKAKGMLKMMDSKAAKKGYSERTGDFHSSIAHSLAFKKGRDLTSFAPAPDVYHTRQEYGAEQRSRNCFNDYNDYIDEHDREWLVGDGKRRKPKKMKKFAKKDEQESPVGFSGREASGYRGYRAGGKERGQLVGTAYEVRPRKESGHFGRISSDSADGNWADHQTGNQHSRYAKNVKGRKWESGKVVNIKSQKMLPVQRNDLRFYADNYMSKDASNSIRRKHFQYSENDMAYQDHSSYAPNEDTQSDSSEDSQEEEEIAHIFRNPSYDNFIPENYQRSAIRSVYDLKNPKKLVKHARTYDGDRFFRMTGEGLLQSKDKLNTETHSPSGNFEETCKVSKNGKILKNPVKGPITASRKKSSTEKKANSFKSDLLGRPSHVGDYPIADLVKDHTPNRRDQVVEAHLVEPDSCGHLNTTFAGCKSVTKKRKSKEDSNGLNGHDEMESMQINPDRPTRVIGPLKKKGKKKADSVVGTSSALNNGNVSPEKEIVAAEAEIRTARKPFTLITPTVHAGFSFSIVHLLSAVRKAMVTVNVEDGCEVKSRSTEEDGVIGSHSLGNLAASVSEEQKSLPSHTVQEIMNCVRSNPGDPCILETQEPLQDLVRGVLKIFSSKTAPLGAKGWKALVAYEKSTKRWSWTGPVSPTSVDPIEEETSAEAWNIPHKMLVKLVDAFANWLKSGQETLKKIGSLPSPPIMDLPNLDEKERFRDLRAQKSLITISPSSDEVRAYFRKEEFLRYQVPDRAFSYTAADGKKSIVAPLRRGGGKPMSKARDHFMLKPDRPPHVTILCLVRDAASRLPGSIGTRADVCALIRDSQYIVEDVSDAQVNQVVSGALDRLHYERDPCVQYDNERKLWVYLHREREEEDFEDDGTSSTKKWKKQKKETTDMDTGAAETNCNGDENQQASASAGIDFNSCPNMDLSPIHGREKTDLLYQDLRPNIEIVKPFIESMEATVQGNPMAWDVLGLKPLQENRMVCQENSTNEDFGDEAFDRERSSGLLNASSL